MSSSRVPMPNIGALLAPLLPALPPATVATQPAIGILPLLSPILRQRVKLLGDPDSKEPWIRLLSYDPAKADRLIKVVQSGQLEPHPVSGEVEIDWEYDAKARYRRRDLETLQTLVILEELELAFQLVYCVGDVDGGGDGWRLSEVSVAEKPDPFVDFGGFSTIAEADKAFEGSRTQAVTSSAASSAATSAQPGAGNDDGEEEEDDDYWNQYDATPAQTPMDKRSPAPQSMQQQKSGRSMETAAQTANAEANYFSQYDNVQPAMDSHDPDEEVPDNITSTLGGAAPVASAQPREEASLADIIAQRPQNQDADLPILDAERAAQLLHPRPASSASSNGSRTVEKLEETAAKQGATEISVKSHVAKSIQSLYSLSRAAGIDREEFERLVKTELDVYSLREEPHL